MKLDALESASEVVGHARRAVVVDARDLHAGASAVLAGGYRLALVAAHDDVDALRIVYLFCAGGPDRRIELVVRTDRTDPVVPSLATLSYPAGRFEREVRDLFGVRPEGHPDVRRLVKHQHWPQGWFPLRRDAPPASLMRDDGEPYPFLPVEGSGVYEIPVGPVHAGLIEPGHFRFSAIGETILRMKSRLWFVHRGIERLFQGRLPADGVELAERVSGDTAVGHSLAYCLAIEDALGIEVPAQAQRIRSVLLELERLYNHVSDVGALCNDVGYGIVHAHSLRLRETLLRLNGQISGHRLLRSAVFPGGARVLRLPTTGELEAALVEFRAIVKEALSNSVVVDRFAGTAILAREEAETYGTLGYVARASGVRQDARHDHPACDEASRVNVASRTAGDVLARFEVRVDEFEASIALLCALLDRTEGTHASADIPPRRRHGSGVGITEAWRGTIVHRVEVGEDGTLARAKIVDPSFLNWPALSAALADTIVPDFPLANKSFNLSYAGNDL